MTDSYEDYSGLLWETSIGPECDEKAWGWGWDYNKQLRTKASVREEWGQEKSQAKKWIKSKQKQGK